MKQDSSRMKVIYNLDPCDNGKKRIFKHGHNYTSYLLACHEGLNIINLHMNLHITKV